MMLKLTIGSAIQWVFRTWVRLWGEQVKKGDAVWLEGPTGTSDKIGASFYEALQQRVDVEWVKNEANSGLMKDFDKLASQFLNPTDIDLRIKDFYQQTVNYQLDAWSHWSWLFRPFAWILVHFVSRNIQQLNLPVNPLETSRGMTSDIIQLRDKCTGETIYTCWLRKILPSNDVIYAGFYSTCRPPNYPGECVKVVFPLPKGSATVILRPIAHADGSLELSSSGKRFGDPGYYRVLQLDENTQKVRYIRAMKETIRVYVDSQGILRTDHLFKFWNLDMLKLHYKLRRIEVKVDPNEF